MAEAHYSYAKRIPEVINQYIKPANKINVEDIDMPMAGSAIIHTHNTYPKLHSL